MAAWWGENHPKPNKSRNLNLTHPNLHDFSNNGKYYEWLPHRQYWKKSCFLLFQLFIKQQLYNDERNTHFCDVSVLLCEAHFLTGILIKLYNLTPYGVVVIFFCVLIILFIKCCLSYFQFGLVSDHIIIIIHKITTFTVVTGEENNKKIFKKTWRAFQLTSCTTWIILVL